MSFRSISKCCFYWFIYTLLPSFFFHFFLVFWVTVRCKNASASVSECKTLSQEILKKESQKPFHMLLWGMKGASTSHTGISTFTYLWYFTCLLSVVLMSRKVSKKRVAYSVYVALVSLWPRTHDHKERVAARLCLHAALLEREKCCLCESIPKWLTAHLCVCTLFFCNWDVM